MLMGLLLEIGRIIVVIVVVITIIVFVNYSLIPKIKFFKKHGRSYLESDEPHDS